MSAASLTIEPEPAIAAAHDERLGSSQPALAFRRLQIERMPGIHHGFTLSDLSPGINVIFGPNGCGKTRSAAAMNMALWPRGAPRQAAIEGTFVIGNVQWHVELDAGTARYRREGTAVQEGPSSLPPADNRDRYNLPLHDLLSEDRSHFAQLIARESAGGFDVPQAALALGYKSAVSNARASTDLRAARTALDEARRRQKGVQNEADTLAALQAQKRAAQLAADRSPPLINALKFIDAQQQWSLALSRVEKFPAALKLLTGTEWKAYQQHSKDLCECRDQQQRAEADKQRAIAARASCRLPETGLRDEVLPTLISLSARLERSVIELRNYCLENDKAQAARSSARARIAPALSDEAIGQLVASNLQPFADLARRAETLRAADRAEESARAWLGGSVHGGPGADPRAVQEGIGFLQRWLREPRPADVTANGPALDPLLPVLIWSAAAFIVLLAIILAAWIHPAWGALIVPAAALAAIYFVRARRTPPTVIAAAPVHEVYAREYSRLTLQLPDAWTPDDVLSLLQKLITLHVEQQIDAERAARWTALEPRRAALQQEREAIGELRNRLRAELGAMPPVDESAMFTVISNVIAWQSADVKVADASAAQAATARNLARDFECARTILDPFGYAVPDDVAAVTSGAQDLRRRADLFEKSRAAQSAAAEAGESAQRRIADLESRVLRLFNDAEIAPDEARTLEDFCKQHPDYCQASKELELARHVRDQAVRSLVGHEELMTLAASQVREQFTEAQEQAALLDSINQQIGGILKQIEEAKKSDAVESCLARYEEAADELREKRDADRAAVAGWALAQYIKQESNDHQRPAVFTRARGLFASVTQGKYRLDLEDSAADGAPATFRAFDNSTGVAHPLNELSGATRLQLLLSVRVAFVEQQEAGARLPLFIDEALANSDEHRAKAIIEAAIELARGGRQVFYFTAQLDEVAKWKQFLQHRPDVSHRLIDLATVRGLAESERLPVLPETIATPPAVPPPLRGMSYQIYGRLLKVPAIDLQADSIGGIHLWHLLDDAAALYEFIRRGPSTWGQVRELRAASRSNGSPRLFAGLEQACARAEAAAYAISAMVEGWKIGRGRPLNRAVLIESEAVSANFEESVARLAREVNFDAVRLIQSLESGSVRGFRSRATNDLQAYLIEQRFLDRRPRLSRDEIRARMLEAVAEPICEGLIDPNWIDGCLDRACFRAGSSA